MTTICTTLGPDGGLGRGLGKASRVALARVDDDEVTEWRELDVGWDELHDSGTEGAHHARIVRFLREHEVGVVVTPGLGDGMRRVLATMGIRVSIATGDDARDAVLTAARAPVE